MLVLGFPDGSLSEHTEKLFSLAGLELPKGFLDVRKYLYPLTPNECHPFGEFQILRPQDTMLAIREGKIDVGVSGQDWFTESCLEKYLEVLASFNYSKAQVQAPQIVVLGRSGEAFHDTKQTVVATEYPVLARKRFKNARIIVVQGKAESWLLGSPERFRANFCVDLYDQGSTARINDLVVVGEPIILSPTILLIAKDSPLRSSVDVFVKKLNKAFTELTT